MSQSNAASQLAPAREQGSLRLAYRRSVVALQQALGWKEQPILEEEGENDPLLRNNGEGSSQSVRQQGGSYGSVLDLPPDQRVPKPKKVRGPVRVEAKVWFANEVSDKSKSESTEYRMTNIVCFSWLYSAYLDFLVASFTFDRFFQFSNVQFSFFL